MDILNRILSQSNLYNPSPTGYSTGGGDIVAMILGGGFFFCIYCLLPIFYILLFVITGLMIADAGSRTTQQLPNKKTWIFAMYFGQILTLGWIFALIYYFTRKQKLD